MELTWGWCLTRNKPHYDCAGVIMNITYNQQTVHAKKRDILINIIGIYFTYTVFHCRRTWPMWLEYYNIKYYRFKRPWP